MSKKDKTEYYIDKLSKEISDDTVSEFLYDRTECVYNDNAMFCPVCSAGCFKRYVLGELDMEDAQKVLHKMFDINYHKNKGEF